MIYQMRCDTCHRILDIGCPMNQHEDIIKPGIACDQEMTTFIRHKTRTITNCNGTLRQVILPARIFSRSVFPGKEPNEIQLPTPYGVDMEFSDKIHAREWLGERGLMSKWIENDM